MIIDKNGHFYVVSDSVEVEILVDDEECPVCMGTQTDCAYCDQQGIVFVPLVAADPREDALFADWLRKQVSWRS